MTAFDDSELEILSHRGPIAAGVPELAAGPVHTRSMVDSAYPRFPEPSADIILIYAGGDTPHPWTDAEIRRMPARYRFPCWVRSDPQDVSAAQDAALFAAWLHGHHVPMGCAVILDLETAVNEPYVKAFNLALRAAGYKVTKYGSQDFIWKNPQTDGGTYVALPGPPVLTTEGDTVARQYGFDGAYDMSVVKSQSALMLWDTRPGVVMPMLRKGDKGKDVRNLQETLNARGKANLAVDGDFGPKTEAAVRKFQGASGLAVDGIVGPKTWAALTK